MYFKVNAASMKTFLVVAILLQLVAASAIPGGKRTDSDAEAESDFEEPQALGWLLAAAI
ncbi:hypothetical protein DFH09DRAFT_1301465 [Mycena vulgaris]|nr:hypothetical protein DFH09DRAFT_1301465 [Mycena vulgaris]